MDYARWMNTLGAVVSAVIAGLMLAFIVLGIRFFLKNSR
jgi:hypothetical protein